MAPLAFSSTAAPHSPDNYYNQQFGPKGPDGNSYVLSDWRRRMLETGGRATLNDRDNSRFVVGLQGVFSNGWDWDVYFLRGDNSSQNYNEGYFNLARVGEVLGPTHSDASGVLQCGTAENPVGYSCVPLNIFGELGTDSENTSEMLQYISGNFNNTNTDIDWTYGNFNQNLAVRYIHHLNETESGWWTAPFVRQVEAFTTVDWQGSYHLEDYNTRFTLGVLNVLDEEPPVAYSAFNANTDGRTYDVIGRQFYLSATVNF